MLDTSGDMQVVRSVGKVSGLKNKVDIYDTSRAHIAIGHTRWATHGGVTEANCHPHISGSGRYAVIHNGIIENHTELRNELIAKGYTFASQTDTEVTVQLFDHIYDGDIVSTMKHLVSRMHGAYGLVFMDRENPDILFGTKK
jgi:glucosamine--fructose-6-phosphate aminotransferase (isomerizing)